MTMRLGMMLLWAWVVLPIAAFADITNGVNWLATQQNANGSFGGIPTSLATEVRSTAEVIRAYQELGQQSQPAYAPALGFLNNDTADQARFLAGKIVVNAKAGNNVTALVSALVAYQNPDGAFGDRTEDDASSIFDTAFALEALTLAGVTDANVIAPAVGYLLSHQQASGGWADGDNVPSVYLTAISLRALWYYRHVYVGVPAALTNGKTFLFSQRDGAGRWGEDFNTALALLAVIPTLPDLSSVTTGITALQAAQLPNGSWVNDPYNHLDSSSWGRLGCLSSAHRRRST